MNGFRISFYPMNYKARLPIAIALLFFACFSLKVQVFENDFALARKVDDYLKSEYSLKRIPGISVCVIRNGKVVFAKGYGFANIELSVPSTEETIYEIASLTKPFTAAAIMMLVEEGKISLEDPVSKYFPEAPATWRNITIRHLLVTHPVSLTSSRFLRFARNPVLPGRVDRLLEFLHFHACSSYPGIVSHVNSLRRSVRNIARGERFLRTPGTRYP